MTRSASGSSSRRSKRRQPGFAGFRKKDIPAIVGGALVVVALGWPIVTHGLSDSAVLAKHPDAAVRFNPASSTATAALAVDDLEQDRAHDAIGHARDAIADSTLAVPAVRAWGLAAQHLNQLDTASKMMGEAAAMGWRDVPTQLWLAAASLQAHSYGDMMRYVDALTKTLGLDPRVQAVLDGVSASTDARPYFLRLLESNPFWREQYFTDTTDVPVERLAVRAGTLQALVGTATPPTDKEVQGVVEALVKGEDYQPAYALWRATDGRNAGAIDDPGFDNVTIDWTNSPFQWRVMPLPGEASDFAGDGKDRAFHVMSDGSATGLVIRQIVALSPGAHRISLQSRIGTPQAANAFRLQVNCLSAGGTTFRSDPTTGTPTSLGLDFVVPADDSCAMQSIGLMLLRTDSPGPAEGWFDNLAVS